VLLPKERDNIKNVIGDEIGVFVKGGSVISILEHEGCKAILECY
jgi:hypothetical protein